MNFPLNPPDEQVKELHMFSILEITTVLLVETVLFINIL
jgi:hypothetical protein